MNFFPLLFISVLQVATPALAQEPVPQTLNPDELFAQGNELYQAQKFAQAAENFRELAARNPAHAPLYFNWGLSEYQAGRKGLGVGLWRRALALRPGFDPAVEALAFASRQMQLRETDDGRFMDWLVHRVLVHVSLDQMLALTGLLLAAGGWLLLTYIGRRRKALRHEEPLPPAPWVGATLAALFVIAAALSALKGYDVSIPRATAITASPVRSAPSDVSSTLFELREGADVVLRQAKKGWTQIRYPGGMSGWVPNEVLFQTSGMQLW